MLKFGNSRHNQPNRPRFSRLQLCQLRSLEMWERFFWTSCSHVELLRIETNLVSFDMSSKLDLQWICCFEHQFTVLLYDGQVDDCCWCLDVFEPLTNILSLESGIGRYLIEERWRNGRHLEELKDCERNERKYLWKATEFKYESLFWWVVGRTWIWDSTSVRMRHFISNSSYPPTSHLRLPSKHAK